MNDGLIIKLFNYQPINSLKSETEVYYKLSKPGW